MPEPVQNPYCVEFTCWNCKTFHRTDIRDVQKDRLEADYVEIHPRPDNPQRYHIRCTECAKFNSVMM